MKAINEYDQQAIDFLEKTGVKFKAIFKKYDYHFTGDTEKRNIFEITLSNKNNSFSFNFGNSINDSCNTVVKNITEVVEEIDIYCGLASSSIKNVMGSVKFKLLKKDNFTLKVSHIEKLAGLMCANYNDSIKSYNQKKPSFSKYKGNDLRVHEAIAHINKKIAESLKETKEIFEESPDKNKPSAYSVLSCLTKYDVGTFEDFCGDFGYDTDSRSAEKIYDAVCEEFKNVQTIWSDSEIELLQEIQ